MKVNSNPGEALRVLSEAALLYENAKKAQERAEKGREQITKLQEITSSLSGAVTQTEIADILLRFMIGYFPFGQIALIFKGFSGSTMEMSTIFKDGRIKSCPKAHLDLNDPIIRAITKQKKLFIRDQFVVPLVFHGRALGALRFKKPESYIYSKEERSFLEAVILQATQALERARLFESELAHRLQAENAQHRFKFLSEASMILSENLNHEKNLKKIVAHSVPRFADGCTVDLIHEDKTLRVAAAHIDPKKELSLFQLALDSGSKMRPPLDKVITSGQPLLISDMGELYRRLESLGKNSELIRSVNIRSLILVPLGPKEKPIGVMGFCTSETDRMFDQSDVMLAEEIGRRATVAVENARLFNQAQESVKLRDEFLSIASHELKTPLTSICLQLELVKRSNDFHIDSNSKLAKAFEVFDLQSERLSKLIDSLLDLTLIQAGRLSLSLEMINLSELIEGAVARLPTSIPKPILELESKIVGFWDRTRLDQVVVNLISNGIKYGGNKPMRIKICQRNERAILSIQDFGMGIAKADQGIIFDRFQRAKGEFKAWGMGLGLFITRQIVEAHHGSIRVESELGKGSTFFVEIPMPVLDRLPVERLQLQSSPMVLH